MGYRVIRERGRVWGVGWNAYAAKARDAETNLKGGAIPFFHRMFACDIANCLTCNCIFSFMNGRVFYLVESYFWTSGYLLWRNISEREIVIARLLKDISAFNVLLACCEITEIVRKRVFQDTRILYKDVIRNCSLPA